MEKLSVKKEILNIIITLFAAAVHAIGLWYLVYPAKFAPSEMAGVYTMIYELTGFNAGYSSLIFNIPLLIIAWFLLKKRYVIYAVLFTVFSSILLIVVELAGMPQYVGSITNANGTTLSVGEQLLAAIFSGVVFGVRTGVMIKIGSSTGGSDILAGMLQKKFPHLNVEKGIAFIGYIIAAASFFVYKDLTSVMLSVVQMFILERVAAAVMKDRRNAIEVKIVTNNPKELKEEITLNLRHSATILESKGMYSDKAMYMVVSVLNTNQLPDIMKMVKKYPNTFVYYSDVLGVKGNFRWRKDEEVK